MNLVYSQALADPLIAHEAKTYTHEGKNNFRTRNVMAFKASHFTRGKDVAPAPIAPPLSADADKGDQDTLIAFDTTQITNPDNRCNAKHGDPCHPLAAHGHPPDIAGFRSATEFLSQSSRIYSDADAAPALQTTGNHAGHRPPQVHSGSGVRRLTPLECERLMGVPDGYTLIPYRGKMATDSPRYKALGNSFPVPVVRWIGARIKKYRSL